MSTGRHRQDGIIVINNNYCPPENATVTIHFSTNYDFSYAVPTPLSYTGNAITWSLSDISSALAVNPVLSYGVAVPSTWLTPGDTVMSSYLTVATIPGDIDTTNNFINRCDTVKSSYDPNEISGIATRQYTALHKAPGTPLTFRIPATIQLLMYPSWIHSMEI